MWNINCEYCLHIMKFFTLLLFLLYEQTFAVINNTARSQSFPESGSFNESDNGTIHNLCRNFTKHNLAKCGGDTIILGNIEKHIESPKNIRQLFENGKTECSWQIISLGGPQRCRIQLNFQSFDMGDTSNCTKNYIEIRNGLMPNASLIERLCGNKIPSRIYSRKNKLFLKFAFDGSMEAIFSATVKCAKMVVVKSSNSSNSSSSDSNIKKHSINNNNANNKKNYNNKTVNNNNSKNNADKIRVKSHITHTNPHSYECVIELGYQFFPPEANCTKRFGDSGVIDSNSCKSKLGCIWRVTSSSNYKIKLNFTKFFILGQSSYPMCRLDNYVIIKNIMAAGQSVAFGPYCGNDRIPIITSINDQLEIVYDFEDKMENSQFIANYRIVHGGE